MASPPFKVKALYDYVSQENDDLNFQGDQIITVTDEEDAEWYYGEYEDGSGAKKEGLFPKNFVKIFEPETPPRPTRASRAKKDPEPAALDREAAFGASTNPVNTSSLPDAPASAVKRTVENAEESPRAVEVVAPEPSTSKSMKQASMPVSAASVASKAPPPAAAKPLPPPVTEKPASNAFRDRINAFNKPTAPPVAPTKPGGLGGAGGSGFIKKPFVAPPPSKNAYMPPPREPPPQKIYRRDEDPEITAQRNEVLDDEMRSPSQVLSSANDEEDQPKPTSLKDRIALLQKQQMEQAARHSEAGQKKEKVKRPKKAVDPDDAVAGQDDPQGEDHEVVGVEEMVTKGSMDASREAAPRASRPKPHKSREGTPVVSPVMAHPREIFSDANDADQSGAGDTEEGEEASTGRDDSDEKPKAKAPILASEASQQPKQDPNTGDVENAPDDDMEDQEEEEEAVDPEVKRRMEIRERMAKMSGGMGMAGMFGPPGGLPLRTSTKKTSGASERNDSTGSVHAGESSSSQAPPVPVIPMSGLQKVRSPEQVSSQIEIDKENEQGHKNLVHGRDPEDMPDIEDIQKEPVPPPRRSTDRAAPPLIPQDRPVPPLPTASRPVPPPPSRQPMLPSEGSESDDELSSHDWTQPVQNASETDDSRPTSKEGPPDSYPDPIPPVPHRPQAPPSPPSQDTIQGYRTRTDDSLNNSPTTASEPPIQSRIPTVPDTDLSMPPAPQSRAPPPPPPSAAAPKRILTAGRIPAETPETLQPDENDEEVTEYDGDYDTDMASGATHKDALKTHARASSLEDDSMTEEASLHHSGLPSIGPPQSTAPRAVPPPPPHQPPPPRNTRQSFDMPRGAPPPPPPSRQTYGDKDEEYDPYKYIDSTRGVPASHRGDSQMPQTPTVEEPEKFYHTSSPQQGRASISRDRPSQYAGSPNMAVPSSSNPRQSNDIQRTSTTIRRSADFSGPSGEHFMANDIDLSESSQWWAQPDAPPPVFQNRRDVIYEVEENSTIRRGGKKSVTKDVYILYIDYSQTVVTAHFEAADPGNATLLEQRHEPPPRNLRQDQLEEAHAKFGTRIADAANLRNQTVVGDGLPHALPLELISSLPDALRPVGVRAYGALVYANLANASVQQFDEIRPGDIVTFRNAKFGGHRGPMKSKYNIEVGKPDHVGIVIDWDGTKKKIRAWEQGRESRKVKPESFKFGDMKSGEVKVWRVMSRSWVGWEGQN